MNFLKSEWHKYPLAERHASWKYFLPISKKFPILTLNLKGWELGSLARSWGVVHVLGSRNREIEWAYRQAIDLGLEYYIMKVEQIKPQKNLYQAIAVNADSHCHISFENLTKHLTAGGLAAWIGHIGNVPSTIILKKYGYQSIKRYAFFPPKHEKLLIPLCERKLTKRALKFYKPGKKINGALLYLINLLNTLGLKDLLGFKQIVIAQKPGQISSNTLFLDHLSKCIGHNILDATVYIGWRNLTMQLLEQQSRCVGIAKVADMGIGADALHHEKDVLKYLGTNACIKKHIPKIIDTGNWKGHICQLQEPLDFAKYNDSLLEEHIVFLRELSKIDRSELFLEEWPKWNEIVNWAKDAHFVTLQEKISIRNFIDSSAQKLKRKKIPFHRVHGDFAPWHTFTEKGQKNLRVIDWQDSEKTGLPLYDLVHYILRRQSIRSRPRFDEVMANPISFLGLRYDLINSIYEKLFSPEDLLRLSVVTYLESDQLGRRIK